MHRDKTTSPCPLRRKRVNSRIHPHPALSKGEGNQRGEKYSVGLSEEGSK